MEKINSLIIIALILLMAGCAADSENVQEVPDIELSQPVYQRSFKFSNLYHYFNIGDKLIVFERDTIGNNSMTIIIDFPSLEKVATLQGGDYVYASSNAKNASIIVANNISEGRTSNKVYDVNGSILFSIDNLRGMLYSSPSSNYYYSTNPILLGNDPYLFDRLGHEVKLKYDSFNSWTSVALNDTVLTIFQTNQILFFNAISGELITSIDSIFEMKDIYHYYGGDLIFTRVNQQGNLLFANWLSKEIIINDNFEIIHTQDLGKASVEDACFSDDGQLLAVLYTSRKDSSNLEVYNSIKTVKYAKYEFHDLVHYRNIENSGMSFVGNLISNQYAWFGRIAKDPKDIYCYDLFMFSEGNNKLLKIDINIENNRLSIIEADDKIYFIDNSKDQNELVIRGWDKNHMCKL